MMCAAQAGRRGRRVLLIEHYPVLGEKIRISGGGRCNFTNVNAGPANYLSQNPDFCRSALSRYTPRDFIALVERHGIRYHEKKLGQLFCDGFGARDHRDAEDRVRSRRRRLADALRRRRGRARRAATVDDRDVAAGRCTRRVAGDRDRRPDGAEDRRDAVRLSHRRAVRSRDRPAAAGAGAAVVPSGGARPLRRPRRRVGRRGSLVRRRALSREPAVHASRTVRSRRSCRSRRTGTAGTR